MTAVLFAGNGSSSGGSQPSPTYIGGGGGAGGGGSGHGGPGGMGQHVGNSPTPSSTPVSCDMQSPVPPVHHSSSGVSGSPPVVPSWDMKPPNLVLNGGHHHASAGYMPQYGWYQTDGPNQGLLS